MRSQSVSRDRRDQAILGLAAVRSASGASRVAFELGNTLARRGRWGAAVTRFRRALVLDPQFDACVYNLGLALWQVGELDRARDAFLRIRTRPSEKDAALLVLDEHVEQHRASGLPALVPGARSPFLLAPGRCHAAVLVAHFRDGSLARWTGMAPLGTIEHARAWIRAQHGVAGRRAAFLVHPRRGLIGGGSLTIEASGARVGYWLATPWRGRGLGTRLLRELARYASELGVRTLVAVVRPDNRPSIGLLEREGFQRVHEPRDGEPTPRWTYAASLGGAIDRRPMAPPVAGPGAAC